MKLSTRGRYGVAIIYDLSQQFGKGPVSLKSIGERQGISEQYLQQLIGSLKSNGYVKSVRGAQGGFELTREPASIAVGDIVRAMEGPIAPVDCLLSEASKNNQYCQRADNCPRRKVWEKLGKSMTKVLDSITFADMCKDSEVDLAFSETDCAD